LAESATEVTFHDLPANSGDYVSVAIYANGPTSAVSEIVLGQSYTISERKLVEPTEINPIDFSFNETDEFGNRTAIRRGWTKRVTYTALVDKSQLGRIIDFIAYLRTVPVVWYDDEIPQGFGLTVLGVWEQFPAPLTTGPLVFLTITVGGVV
jgi:hypothetical protein